MSPDDANNNEHRPQFRLRHLLIVTAIAAGVIAISAPLLRDFDRQRWMMIAATGVGFSAGALAVGLFGLIPRYYAQKRAGTLLLELRDRASLTKSLGFSGFMSLMTIFNVGIVLFYILLPSPPQAGRAFLAKSPFLPGVFAFVAAMCVFHAIWPPPHPRLHENGFVWGPVFIPWEKLSIARWDRLYPDVLQVGTYFAYRIKVAPHLREQVEAILRTHAAGFIQSPGTSHSKD
ncbi:hypothetical protein LOC68_22655 [Blastopirellula sp. JC732]|uniref:Uncharacterized protein n=1 Tax=Blastopirellula sediminis TaxID=2894196 RepID=A0A9X1MPU2_9BACT|nr:hypothetical protein [Blastopirellula sediminis]MCC9605497.1 hypothetical protein [Blastopirellula sediminis]MCC9631203.1 hypothetical protein [Blastopirellula sediminis]